MPNQNGKTPVAFFNLPSRAYPFTIEAVNPTTGDVVWSKQVERPADDGKVGIYIPPLKKQLGHPVTMRIKFADGTIQESGE